MRVARHSISNMSVNPTARFGVPPLGGRAHNIGIESLELPPKGGTPNAGLHSLYNLANTLNRGPLRGSILIFPAFVSFAGTFSVFRTKLFFGGADSGHAAFFGEGGLGSDFRGWENGRAD